MATRFGAQSRIGANSTALNGQVTIPRWRIRALLLFCAGLTLVVVFRLVQVQVLEHTVWLERARAEIDQQVVLQPQRGVITDRAGNVLAMDVERESLWAVPPLITADDAPKLALVLAPLIQRDASDIQAVLTSDQQYVRLARWLEPEIAEQISLLEEQGLRLEYEPRRVYPQDTLAAQVVGATNHEGDGISGVESFYDSALRGVAGTLTAEFDPARNPIAIAPQYTDPPRNGVNVQLTIDPLVQHLIEAELRETVQQHNADGGTILVMEPSTGAIRGMASWPPFDPNEYFEYPEEVFSRNPAVSNVYEPGSTFKMITVAIGMQTRAFTADTLVNDTGVLYRYGQPLRNWNGAANGMLDPGGVLYHSSNVGAMLLNELIGEEDFYRYVEAFGFGQPTGVDLGGEEAGIVPKPGSPGYDELKLLVNSYGQGIAVTPLQMVRAAAVIANDGVMMTPYVVEQRCENGECIQHKPEEGVQVIEPGVAWTVRRMLVQSANHYSPVVWAASTGNWGDQWLVPGYQVCAKTGTSSIPSEGGGYDPNFTIGSVLGFAPAEEARYVVLVKIDRPKDDIWGVRTAVPVYQRIVDQLLQYERIPPDATLRSPGQQ